MSTKTAPHLRVDLQACTGCRTCTIVCAVSHTDRLEFARTRIRVEKTLPGMATPVFKPVFCRMCRNAKCIPACPTGALVEDPETGIVKLKTELCNGCGKCVTACPFHAIWLDPAGRVALKCDLCGGEPTCVGHCPAGALSFDGSGKSS